MKRYAVNTQHSDTRPGPEAELPNAGADRAVPHEKADSHAEDGHHGEAGYNLVIVTVMLTVMNIALAAALPRWSVQIQREREEELIFRGLQYAEAIHQFNKRFQRLPVRLEELLEVEPRHIRQLWTNPMREDGRWALIFQGTGTGRRGQNNPNRNNGLSQDDEDDPNRPPGQPGDEPVIVLSGADDDGLTQVASGPISGVYSPTDEDSIKTWFDSNSISDWKFTYDLLGGGPRRGGPQGQGGDPQRADLAGGQQQQLPVNAGRIGRPFPPGVQPQGGGAQGASSIPGRPRGSTPGSAGGPGGAAVQGINEANQGNGASPGQGRN